MVFSLGWILGPIDLILAGAALFLLIKNRMKVNPKYRLILDFALVSIICSFFWGVLGGTAKHMGWVDEDTASLLSQVLATLYLVFTFLAVWYAVNNLNGKPKISKKKK